MFCWNKTLHLLLQANEKWNYFCTSIICHYKAVFGEETAIGGVVWFIVKYFYVLTFELWRVFPKFPHTYATYLNCMVQKYIFTLKHRNNWLLRLWPHGSGSVLGFPAVAHAVQNCTFVLLSSLCTVSKVDFDIKSEVLHSETFIVCTLWKIVQVALFWQFWFQLGYL